MNLLVETSRMRRLAGLQWSWEEHQLLEKNEQGPERGRVERSIVGKALAGRLVGASNDDVDEVIGTANHLFLQAARDCRDQRLAKRRRRQINRREKLEARLPMIRERVGDGVVESFRQKVQVTF